MALTPYQTRVTADGATAYWPLDDPDGSPTARDLAGTRTGTLVGPVSCGAAGVGGSRAMQFPNVEGGGVAWITLPSWPAVSPQFSIEAWVWFAASGAGSGAIAARIVPGEYWTQGGSLDFAVYHGADPNHDLVQEALGYTVGTTPPLEFRYLDSVVPQSLPPLPPQTWHHVVGTHDGTTARLYRDGALAMMSPSFDRPPLAPDGAHPFQCLIGAFPPGSGTYAWGGRLQDIAWYPRVLTAQEVADHYALHVGGGPLAPLVTLDQAKRQVLIPPGSTTRDAELTEVVDRASAVIRDYLKDKDDPTWTPATAPLVVQQATLLLLGYYWVHRGDDWDQATDDELWAGLERLLARSRVPTVV